MAPISTYFFLAIAAASAALAMPAVTPACNVKCGDTCFNNRYLQGQAADSCGSLNTGTSDEPGFPLSYTNPKGLQFLSAGPYYEFPAHANLEQTGGDPGSNRVIVSTANGKCQYVGTIIKSSGGDQLCDNSAA